MDEKIIFKTNDFVTFIKESGISVTVNENPDSSTIERIKNMIIKKKELFTFQKSLFK